MVPASHYGAPGTGDFIQYWTAFQLLLQQSNPYDEVLMHGQQLVLGQFPDRTIMMWNPPWTLMMLAPILFFNFVTAAQIWLLFNIIAVFAIAILVRDVWGSKETPLWVAVVPAAFFVPIWENLAWGQLGVFLALFVALFFWAEKRSHDLLAGASLVMLTAKSHLFLAFFLYLAIWIIVKERYKILVGALIALAILIGSTTYMRPTVVYEWIAATSAAEHLPGVVSVRNWKTAAIATSIRSMFEANPPPMWPVWGVLLAGLLGTGAWLAARWRDLDLKRNALPVLGLSLIISPYGWLYDQSILVIVQIVLALHLWNVVPKSSPRLLWLSVLGMQLTLLSMKSLFNSPQSAFFWFPALMLIGFLDCEAQQSNSTWKFRRTVASVAK